MTSLGNLLLKLSQSCFMLRCEKSHSFFWDGRLLIVRAGRWSEWIAEPAGLGEMRFMIRAAGARHPAEFIRTKVSRQ